MTFKMKHPPEEPVRHPKVAKYLDTFYPDTSSIDWRDLIKDGVADKYDSAFHDSYSCTLLETSAPSALESKPEIALRFNVPVENVYVVEHTDSDYDSTSTSTKFYYVGPEPEEEFAARVADYTKKKEKYDLWAAQNFANIERWKSAEEAKKLREAEESKAKREKELDKLKKKVAQLEKLVQKEKT